MCDYSLMGIPNRLANQGEELVLYCFPSATKGFASPRDVVCTNSPAGQLGFWEGLKSLFRPPSLSTVPAVCVPPGARLLLQGIPKELQCAVHVRSVETVTFTQLSSDAHVHRDAVRFSNGSEVSLQTLREGQRAKILSLDLGVSQVPVQPEEMVLHFG